MGVFVVVKRGVFRHGVAGVALSYGVARGIALEAIKAEPDDHHKFEVLFIREVGVGVREEDEVVVGYFKRNDTPHSPATRYNYNPRKWEHIPNQIWTGMSEIKWIWGNPDDSRVPADKERQLSDYWAGGACDVPPEIHDLVGSLVNHDPQAQDLVRDILKC